MENRAVGFYIFMFIVSCANKLSAQERINLRNYQEEELKFEIFQEVSMYSSYRATSEFREYLSTGLNIGQYKDVVDRNPFLGHQCKSYDMSLVRYAGSNFPDTTYEIYEWRIESMEVRELIGVCPGKNNNDICSYYGFFSVDQLWFTKLAFSGLIAIPNKEMGAKRAPRFMKISGFMFLDDLKKFYFQSDLNKENLIKYIDTKYFNFAPDSINCEILRKAIFCKFYSKTISAWYDVKFSIGSGYSITEEQIYLSASNRPRERFTFNIGDNIKGDEISSPRQGKKYRHPAFFWGESR